MQIIQEDTTDEFPSKMGTSDEGQSDKQAEDEEDTYAEDSGNEVPVTVPKSNGREGNRS